MERKFDPNLTYDTFTDDCINDFYRPALKNCKKYQRSSGYFSSTTFAHVAKEILDFIEANGKIELIASPEMSESDIKILGQNNLEREKSLGIFFLDTLKKNPDNLKLQFSKLMGYMLTNKIEGKPQLEIKIAIPLIHPGIFHQKIGIMHYDDDERIAFSGSINETGMGWSGNKENFTVFKSWGDGTHIQGIDDNQKIFNNLWNGNDSKVEVFDLPHAVKDHLLKIRPTSNAEMRKIIDDIKKILDDEIKKDEPEIIIENKPVIKLHDYQNNARNKWFENDLCGFLEMATGTGKTFTAFGCINKLQKLHPRTVIIIACPQKHLVEQWKREFLRYNSGVEESEKITVEKTITCNSDYPKWKDQFEEILHDYNDPPIGSRTYIVNNIVIFTTHKTLASNIFTEKILKIKNAKKFLIVDEVHNITSDSSEKTLLSDYDCRLGLSATPTRHMDDEGTGILTSYFHSTTCQTTNPTSSEKCSKCGKPLITYSLDLATAIHKLHVLCPYYYYPYYVSLTSNEMDIYNNLTGVIARAEVKRKKGLSLSNYEKSASIRRADLITNAENKDRMLEDILTLEFNNRLHLTLIYCTNSPKPESPPMPKQLERVKNILFSKGIKSDSVTYEDPTKHRGSILSRLQGGIFDCVTAVRCLDEGVDVPAVETGIFMASSGNPKQFIQRRGRILRKNEITNKKYAYIYDILVTPPTPPQGISASLNERKLIAKELLRHKQFALIANNKLDAIKKIKDMANEFEINLDQLDYDYIHDLT